MNKASPHVPDVVNLDAVCLFDGATLCKLAQSRTRAFCPVCERAYALPTLELIEE